MKFLSLFKHVLMNEAGDGGDGAAAAPAAAPAAAATTALPDAKTTKDQPAEKPPEAEKPGDAEVLDKAGFVSSDDPGLNYSLTFLAKAGFTADNPAVDAAMSGDFSLLKAEMAQKGLPGWEQALALGEQAYGRAVDAQKATQAEVGKVVTDVAAEFGVDWEQAVAHIGSSASAEEKTALNGLMANPATARIAAAYIANGFLNSDGVEREPMAQATADGAAPAHQAAGGKLTRKEYTQEMAALRGKLGDDYINSAEAQALYKRLG